LEKIWRTSKKLALSGTKVPSVSIEDTHKQIHYAFDERKEITLDNLRTWAIDFIDGKLEPSLISEPLPEKNDGPVKVIVGNNYKEIVLDETKDVFLELYAPWCGHCKALAPIWEQLGEAFKDHPSIVIAKMDAVNNFYDEGTKVHMFPTLKLFKAGDKEHPIQYESQDRELEDLVNWVNTNCGQKTLLEKEDQLKKDEL